MDDMNVPDKTTKTLNVPYGYFDPTPNEGDTDGDYIP